MKTLKFDGKAAVVLPEGVLFRTNGAYKTVKEELLQKFNVHTIISLPAGVFLPYSAVKTSIIFFDRTTPTKDIWFYEVPLIDGKKLTKNNGISKEHFEEAKKLFKERPDTENSWLVPVEEVIKNEYNLSAAKYNPNKVEEEELLDPQEYAQEIYELMISATEEIKSLLEVIEVAEHD